tara:strand:+ start:40 stop:651 length:612 start_codon:yes stop_codon:yes gene_type:complete
LYKKNKDFKWAIARDNFLTESECDDLVDRIKSNKEMIDNEDFIERNGSWVSFNGDPIADKIFKVVQLANQMCFKFNIGGVGGCYGKHYFVKDFENLCENGPLHADLSTEDGLVVESSEDGTEVYRDEGLEKELDVFDTTTKLTVIVFLNDDFEGGDLVIWDSAIKVKKGRIVIFPSFAGHRVRKFTGKDRFVLATFIKGDYFR